MKLRRKSDDKVFEFNLNNIYRGAWVVELISVNGDPADSYSDPFPNEREARQYIRNSLERWVYSSRYGWCQE